MSIVVIAFSAAPPYPWLALVALTILLVFAPVFINQQNKSGTTFYWHDAVLLFCICAFGFALHEYRKSVFHINCFGDWLYDENRTVYHEPTITMPSIVESYAEFCDSTYAYNPSFFELTCGFLLPALIPALICAKIGSIAFRPFGLYDRLLSTPEN
ncbi:MAG: hypothetical protein AAF564_03775 [Bacteroidota bacterium]